MKKCPTCQKTFEDALRFCQIDGTPLVDDAPPLDPYKTIVARPIDISESVPAAPVTDEPGPSDPVIEMPAPVESAADVPVEIPMPPIDEPEELLEVSPPDPLKTMYVSDEEMRAAMGSLDQPETPAFEISAAEPEPPKFIEPELTSPVFGSMPPAAPPVIETPAETPPFESAAPDDVFSMPAPPIASPFDSNPPVSHDPEAEAATIMQEFPPASPFSTPASPFSPTPEPVYTPTPAEPVFMEPEPFQPAVVSPFQQDASPAVWTPPPAPDASWQNQPIGQNTPFQPPPAGASGPSMILAIISLALAVVGILSAILTLLFSLVPLTIVICGIPPFLLGVAAAITGFLARSRAASMPDKYAGGGVAMAGLILGILDIIAPFVIAGIWVLLWSGLSFLN